MTAGSRGRNGHRLGAAGAPFLRLLGLIVVLSQASAGPAGAIPAAGALVPSRDAGSVHKVAVFGNDDRRALPPSHRYLQDRIGLLYEARSRSVCTAFCVAPGIVATAAHCLYRTSGEAPPRLSDISFRLMSPAARTQARILGTTGGQAAQHVMSGSMRLNVRPPIDATRDWALVRLSQPACSNGVLKIAPRSASELIALAAKDHIYQVAYHRDFRAWELAMGRPCSVRKSFAPADPGAVARDFSNVAELVLHDCDTGGASSGSPLLVDGPTGPEVVGINVGTYVQSRVLMQDGKVLHRYRASTVANTGVNASAFASRLAAFERSEILGAREGVRSLQELLKRHGLYAAAIDGSYGPKLREAIERFERMQGRPVTGLATTEILRLAGERETTPAGPVIAVEGARMETGSVAANRRLRPTRGGGGP